MQTINKPRHKLTIQELKERLGLQGQVVRCYVEPSENPVEQRVLVIVIEETEQKNEKRKK